MAQELKVQRIAGEILELQAKIAAVRDTLKPLQEMEDAKYDEMLAEMRVKRMDGWKNDDGITFTRSFRKGYEITDEKEALNWAKQNNCVSVNKTAMSKALTGVGALPTWVEYKETEVLTVKKAKEEQI